MQAFLLSVTSKLIPSIDAIVEGILFIALFSCFYGFVISLFRYLSEKITRTFPAELRYLKHPFTQLLNLFLLGPSFLLFLWWWGIDIKHLIMSLGFLGGLYVYILKAPLDNAIAAILLITQHNIKGNQIITVIFGPITMSGHFLHLDLNNLFLESDKFVYIIPNNMLNHAIIKVNEDEKEEFSKSLIQRLKNKSNSPSPKIRPVK